MYMYIDAKLEIKMHFTSLWSGEVNTKYAHILLVMCLKL